MIWTRDIQRGLPERVYIVVRNVWSQQLDVGEAPVFLYGSTWTTGDGIQVTPRQNVNQLEAYLAGIVGPSPIAPGSLGLVQVYGFVPRVKLYSAGATDWMSALTSTGINNWLLVPWTTTDTAQRGALLPTPWVSTYTTLTNIFAGLMRGGGLVNLVSTSYDRKVADYIYEASGFVRAL
jgi:hypothetical protein